MNTMNTMHTNHTMNTMHTKHDRLMTLKKRVLYKKILHNFIIDKYNKMDRIYRWLLILFAVLTPIIDIFYTSFNLASIKQLSIATSCIVAIGIKTKEYITFDKTRDIAKDQVINYTQLYDQIEQVMMDVDIEADTNTELWFQLFRDYALLERSDPDLGPNDKAQFAALCVKLNITYNPDVDLLHDLLNRKSADSDNTPGLTPRQLIQYDKETYRQCVKEHNTAADMKWAMERLHTMY